MPYSICMTKSRYKLYNLDREQSACFGGVPSEHDHCVVYDTTQEITNPLTGQKQQALVFSGTLKECSEFLSGNR